MNVYFIDEPINLSLIFMVNVRAENYFKIVFLPEEIESKLVATMGTY